MFFQSIRRISLAGAAFALASIRPTPSKLDEEIQSVVKRQESKGLTSVGYIGSTTHPSHQKKHKLLEVYRRRNWLDSTTDPTEAQRRAKRYARRLGAEPSLGIVFMDPKDYAKGDVTASLVVIQVPVTKENDSTFLGKLKRMHLAIRS